MSEEQPEMTLDEAITVLCELHINYIMEEEHWTVQTAPMAHPLAHQYVRAWQVLRKRLLAYRGVGEAVTDGAAPDPT